MSCYPENTTFASTEYRILDLDIEPTVRFKLRKDEQYALPGAFALLRIAPEPTFHLGARTFRITQFIYLPWLDHPASIRLVVLPFRIDSVKITIILGIYLLMYLENIILNTFDGFFSIAHIIAWYL